VAFSKLPTKIGGTVSKRLRTFLAIAVKQISERVTMPRKPHVPLLNIPCVFRVNMCSLAESLSNSAKVQIILNNA